MIAVSDFVVYTFSQLYRNIKSFTVHSSPFDQAHLDAAWKTRHLVASHIIRKKSLHALKHLHGTIYKMHSVKEIWLASNKLVNFLSHYLCSILRPTVNVVRIWSKRGKQFGDGVNTVEVKKKNSSRACQT